MSGRKERHRDYAGGLIFGWETDQFGHETTVYQSLYPRVKNEHSMRGNLRFLHNKKTPGVAVSTPGGERNLEEGLSNDSVSFTFKHASDEIRLQKLFPNAEKAPSTTPTPSIAPSPSLKSSQRRAAIFSTIIDSKI
ncbi:MAG TPA: hypothetical protein VJV05_07195 [Pyrinomonadaceae bacterium]|nr:hypothetical protein [Pyrinomonadaceae bacterium]